MGCRSKERSVKVCYKNSLKESWAGKAKNMIARVTARVYAWVFHVVLLYCETS